MDMSKPAYSDDVTCPICGAAATALVHAQAPRIAEVTWCSMGHVAVSISGEATHLYTFEHRSLTSEHRSLTSETARPTQVKSEDNRTWYINRNVDRDGGAIRRTVDKIDGYSEARNLRNEYATSDPMGAYTISSHPLNDLED